ncbi:hypothetical protein FQA39_LY16661 [Lamprigera yunnana]|nr:hypothetical protein FQA39_LY16661 [Lamprigera yunnana]
MDEVNSIITKTVLTLGAKVDEKHEKRNIIEYTEINKTIRQKIKEDLQNHNGQKIEKIIENNRGIKCLSPTLERIQITKLIDEDGKDHTGKHNIAKIAEKYYKNL